MQTAGVIVIMTDDIETNEWWFGERMTALVDRLIPRWIEEVEGDSTLTQNVQSSITQLLLEDLPAVSDEIKILTRSGRKIRGLWLSFGYYDLQRKVVLLNFYCGHSEGSEILKRMFMGKTNRAGDNVQGYLLISLYDMRIGTMVLSDTPKPVDELSPGEREAIISHHI